MFNKLKQINELRDKAKKIQAILGEESATGTAAWNKVKVTVNGNQILTHVDIDESLMTDRLKLQEAIKEATNDALQKIQRVMATKLREVGGLDLAKELGDHLPKS